MDKAKEIVIRMDNILNRVTAYEVAKVQVTYKNGSKVDRIVSVHSLMQAFDKSLVKNINYIPMGRMPFGYYDGDIMLNNGKISAHVVTILPAGKQLMTYEKTQYDICIPSLLFYFEIMEGKLSSTKVFALKGKRVDDKTKLCIYPFGNVSTYNGSVCWGSNVLEPIDKLKKLDEIITLFIQSPCNSDHFRSEACCGKPDLTLRAFFEQLKSMDEYPDEYLVVNKKDKPYRTIGDLLKKKR